jgi:beta-fructofuranosidase
LVGVEVPQLPVLLSMIWMRAVFPPRFKPGSVLVDRNHASQDARAAGGTYTLPCPHTGDALDVRMVVDGSIAEIYLSSGQALTLRFYPTGSAPWRLTTTGAGHTTVEAWDLRGDGIHQQLLITTEGYQWN